MAKFYGSIGYSDTQETAPGVWSDVITTRNYSGDIIRNARSLSVGSDSTNDDLNVSNQFSILADPYAYQNFHSMRYIEFMGAKWKITSVDASQRPRLILTVGGVYNE